MCGIAGELRLDGSSADVGAVERMTDALAPRGPDGSGIWASGRVALGHRRLAIIDLSNTGQQPMVDSDLGLTVVFNGCIYNHHQLRRDLEAAGYRFFSTSDTEVILKAYHRWGDAFVERLIGMFALCIVERDSGRAVLARDRLGIKPLYVAPIRGGLRFASTLPALVRAGGIDTTVDPIALHHYLTFHAVVPAPRTLLNGVQKLPPATVLTVEPDGKHELTTYWDLDGAERRERTDDEWREAIAAALRVAVDRRLVADVPVGVLLSGGLDSSLIVGLLSEAGQTGLSTFSIGFDTIGDEEGDEFRYSDLVAERFGTDHHKLRVPTADVFDALPDVIFAMSEPMVSHDVVAFHLLSRYVSQHVKVVQSGQGADEVFAGYHWYQALSAASGDGVDDYASVFFDRTTADIEKVVSPGFMEESDPSRDFVVEQFARATGASPVERALRIDTEVMLVEDPVKRVDNTTMASGLEGRVPFLDHELVELAFACPTHLKLADGGKGILKDIARTVIPHEVIDRPKGYFPVPPLIHLEGPYVDMLGDALRSPVARDRRLFRNDRVEALLAEPNQLTTLRYNQLWEIGLLELWLQSHGIR
jgi:asparagine synthase (glutamine-hydrolysing)